MQRASAECEQLIKDLDDLHSAAFMSVDDSMLFAPTKVTTIAQFQAIQFSAFIKMNVNRMLGYVAIQPTCTDTLLPSLSPSLIHHRS